MPAFQPGFISISVILSAFFGAQMTGHCGSGSWSRNTGGSWSLTTNWAAGLIAGGTGANAGFSGFNVTADAIVTLDGGRTVGSFLFADTVPSHNWVLNAGTGGTLTLDSPEGIPTISVNNQSAFVNVSIAGTKGLAKAGPGTLVLSGSNVYTGGTMLNGGVLEITGANSLQGTTTVSAGTTLRLNAGAAVYGNKLDGEGLVQVFPGSGAATLTGDFSQFSGNLEIPATGSTGKVLLSPANPTTGLSAAASVSVKAGATLYLGTTETPVASAAQIELLGTGNSENLGALRIEKGATWNGPVTLKSDSAIGCDSGVGTISGIIGESGGSFGITKRGAQLLVLAAANTYTGDTIQAGSGTLCLAHPLALQNSTLQITSGDLTFDQAVTPAVFSIGGLSGSGNISLSTSSTSPTGVCLAVGGNHSGTTYSGVLGGNGSLEKTGEGVLTLSGKNTYSGATIVSSGTLRLGKKTQLPAGLKIMPLGDSITYGYNGGNAGYRGPLYNLLYPLAPDFQFIGTSIERPGLLPVAPIDQRHNEGHSSYTLDDVIKNLDGFDNTRFLQYGGAERNPNGGHWLDGIPNVRAPFYPDVITIMLGSNDVDIMTGIDVRLRNVIEKITTLRPETRLMVAQVIPNTLFPANTAAYNQIIAAQVAEMQAMGRNVYLVDLNTGFPANGLFDEVHPNDIGFDFMAGRWRDAILGAYLTDGELPPSTPTTVSGAGELDLAGLSAKVGNLSGAGSVKTGNGGVLTVDNSAESSFSGALSGAGELVKTGAAVLNLDGNATHTGATRVKAGTLRVLGTLSGTSVIQVFAGAKLDLAGGNLNAPTIHIFPGGKLVGNGVVNGHLVNEGEIDCRGDPLQLSGAVTNQGLVRTAGGASLVVSGSFTNRGTVDFINGVPVQAAEFVNEGIILEAGAVRLDSFDRTDGIVRLTLASHSGHFYQLQYSEDLSSGSWQNAGAPQPGATGTSLELSTTLGGAADRAFYRVVVTP